MTFNENDVNREQDGKFGAKTGWPPDPSVTLGGAEAVSDERIEYGRAIAKRFAPGGHLQPVFNDDGSIDLFETDGKCVYNLGMDEDGLPTSISILGERQRYDSGAFREAENTAYETLGVPYPSNHDRNNRHIGLEVERAGDLFTPQRLMNGKPGDPYVSTPEIRVGTGPDGERIYASLSLEYVSKTQKNMNLDEVDGTWTFSMQGTEKSKTGRELGGGQNVESIRESTGKNGVDTERLAELWERNHLNTMHAGTYLQEMEVKGHRNKNPQADYTELSSVVKDQQGYKYGSSWLYKPVPADELAETIALLKKAQ